MMRNLNTLLTLPHRLHISSGSPIKLPRLLRRTRTTLTPSPLLNLPRNSLTHPPLLRTNIIPRFPPLPPRNRQIGRTIPARRPINSRTNHEPNRIREVVRPGNTNRCFDAYVIQKPVEIGNDADQVCKVGAPVSAVEVVVDAHRRGVVEIGDVEVAACDEVIVAKEHAGNSGEEDLVGGEEGDED